MTVPLVHYRGHGTHGEVVGRAADPYGSMAGFDSDDHDAGDQWPRGGRGVRRADEPAGGETDLSGD